MDKIIDIRPIKNTMRSESRERRRSMNGAQKASYDKKICNKLLNSWAVREASAVLTYVSTSIEVDTRAFIESLFALGKTVAVPRCGEAPGEMGFYVINSFNDLEDGAFGVLEPKRECTEYAETQGSVCVVPAFIFDEEGYRLGYGKGYYDRFLSRYGGKKIGICYDCDICEKLYHGRYDRAVDMIITPRRILVPSEKGE